MPRFCANLSLLFTESPILERFQAAKNCGFGGVEIQFPYEKPAEEIRTVLESTRLDLVLFNVPAGDLMAGGEGLAGCPEKRAEFIAAVDEAKRYAEILHPKLINVLPGRCFRQERVEDYLETFCGNLGYAAEEFSPLGIRVVFEAVNTRDMPGFLVSSGAQMLEILRKLDHPNLFLQYDIYHMHMMGEDVFEFFPRHTDRIGHVQFADVPGRGEPGSGSIDFARLFHVIDRSGYRGWLGAEYRPSGTTADSLDWLNRYG